MRKMAPDDQNPGSLRLGFEGFAFDDLYRPEGLRRLSERFDQELKAADEALFSRFDAYRAAGATGLSGPQESELLIAVSDRVSQFVARLFGIEAHIAALRQRLTSEHPLFDFKREFIGRRVFRKGAPDRPTAQEFPALHARMGLLLQLAFPESLKTNDPEKGLAEAILTLLQLERDFSSLSSPSSLNSPGGQPLPEKVDPQAVRAKWTGIRTALLSTPQGKAEFGSSLIGEITSDPDNLRAVKALLSLADRWTFARALHPQAKAELEDWVTHQLPHPLHFDRLVELHHPDPAIPELSEGPTQLLRRRDGFALTDRRHGVRQVMNEVDYCVLCHEREKDSCSSGFPAKDPIVEGHTFKKNPLGIPLIGCPLDERISETHALKRRGDSVAGLAMVMLDNPMCPGTGHRICNDCMRACIFQKQEPVDIPQVETSVLTDVLSLPWGFEIYGLFTRWNPLNIKRPHPLPYVGKNVMVVGMGPAGYTLSHYLLNEGFGVAGVDGLKIEPFDDALLGRNGHKLEPIRDFKALSRELNERVLAGFGGVSEYGITVRWDKNFLTLIHLTLARRANFRVYGGIRFGGTLTIEDAWELGFDHLAIASGAGRPTIIGLKNNLIRGIRKASDFLMALQLSGAFKKESIANLQVSLPAIVIGGGLTAIDTATELMAYYPVQVEKILDRHEVLVRELGEAVAHKSFDAIERETLELFLEHGRAIRAERQRAEAAGEPPDFTPLIKAWGGVSVCYRRSLTESPAYRLNHEEVAKALEEGIRFIERMSPQEALEDAQGAVRAIIFERMTMVDGKLKGTGQTLELPAKTVCVAAGTSPNVTYEKEYPGTFELDARAEYFKSYDLEVDPAGKPKLLPHEAHKDLGKRVGFFTSYHQHGRTISYYGDNHPTYAGNVVKAMASAKDGYGEISRLFAHHVGALDLPDAKAQAARDLKLTELFARLDEAFLAKVVAVNRLTSTIVEVVVRAPFAAKKFQPGQFYRLQNYEGHAPRVENTRLSMEGLALTGAWVDKTNGLLSTIVLEMGSSSRLCAVLRPGEPVVMMGPTGAPTDIPVGETVLLAGGGLGNAVLFSIAKSLKSAGCQVIYFAGYRSRADLFKQEEIEAATDQVIWSVDSGPTIAPSRPQDASLQGNVVQAMLAFAKGELGVAAKVDLAKVDRVIAIGSDRMMQAVQRARHEVLQPYLKPGHEALGSINSPMQCMMKEICAQCLQKHIDPITGKETVVFSCFNQDQRLDHVDWTHLNSRLKANSVQEKISNLWIDRLLKRSPHLKRV